MNASEKNDFNSVSPVAPISKDTRASLHNAIDKAAGKAQPVADRIATRAHSGLDRVGATVESLATTLAERSKQAGVVYGRVAESGRGYVRNKPAVSLLVAVAAGYGLSKLLGGRK
jgi:ElaB protein